MAGKQLWDKDPRWQLFWTMLDIISHILTLNPDLIYLMENVKMKWEFDNYITNHILDRSMSQVFQLFISPNLIILG